MRTIIYNGVQLQGRCWSVLFIAWWEPIKLQSFCRIVDLCAEKCSPFALKHSEHFKAMLRQAIRKKGWVGRWTLLSLATFQFLLQRYFLGSLTVLLVTEQPKRWPMKAYNLFLSRFFKAASVCVSYAIWRASFHRESTDSLILPLLNIVMWYKYSDWYVISWNTKFSRYTIHFSVCSSATRSGH